MKLLAPSVVAVSLWRKADRLGELLALAGAGDPEGCCLLSRRERGVERGNVTVLETLPYRGWKKLLCS